MKRVVLATLILVVAMGIAASNGVAAGGSETKVVCWNNDYPKPVGNGNGDVKVEPSKCGFFKRGEVSNSGAVRVVSMDWTSWGDRKAKGEGVAVANMGSRVDVEVRLSKPVRNCAGKQFFSKVSFTFDGSRNSDFKLYSCPHQRRALARPEKRSCDTVYTEGGTPLVFFKQNMKCSTAKKYAHRLMRDGSYDPRNFKCERHSPTEGGCTHRERPRKLFLFYPEH